MRKFLLTVFLLAALQIRTYAQNVPFDLKKCSEIIGNRIVNDNLGNIYILEKSSLKKYDAEGNFLYSYTELSDGQITDIDVTDPLKIIIFNSDFGKIKFLDNKLSLKKDAILLPDLGFNSASLVAASYDSGFWIFDPLLNQLVRFDKDLQLSQQSGNISDLIGYEFKPDFIIEYDNKVYVNDPQYGIFVFDRYGTYLKNIPVRNIPAFQIFSNQIIYLEKNVLKSLDIKTYEEKTMKLPAFGEEIICVTIDSHTISLLSHTKFCIYKYQ
jgi:hypothetical protein